MYIHIVQPGETIISIAEKYGVTVEKLIRDNELIYQPDLVPGQTIVITYPEQTYTVQEGDTLVTIANSYGVSIMQLLRNNPHLSGMEALIPGDTLVISYNTGRKVVTNGFSYPFINKEILNKTLPNLTYISVFNYTVTTGGYINSEYDDTDIIQQAINYGVIPLMMTTSFTSLGVPNIEVAYELLTNEESQNRYIDNILDVVHIKGFYGVNIIYHFINASNQQLYQNLTKKLSDRLSKEGYVLIITINPNIAQTENTINFNKVDYSIFNNIVNYITFLSLVWGTNYGTPSPVISINNIKTFLDYAYALFPSEQINLGIPVVGYDWKLPYMENSSAANSLTLHSALNLAYDYQATINFDEVSQTPYFLYDQFILGAQEAHIVWFIDARTINSLFELINGYDLNGCTIWNIMIYYAQVWLVINSQYEIVKLIPDNF